MKGLRRPGSYLRVIYLAEEAHANTVLWDKDGTKFMMSNELSVHPSWRKGPQRAAWFKRTWKRWITQDQLIIHFVKALFCIFDGLGPIKTKPSSSPILYTKVLFVETIQYKI